MKKTALVLLLLLFAACRGGETPAATTSRQQPAGRPAQPAATPEATGAEVGSTMPSYEALWLDGSKFDLSSKRGKVVLLNLWATWCGPCRYEIPELQRLHDAYAGRDFEVIGVSVDESGLEAVRTFVAENKMTYPIVLDEPGKLATIMNSSVLPTSVLLDRAGKVVWKKYGLIRENDPELKVVLDGTL